MSHADASAVLVFRSSRNTPGPRALTHILKMRAGAPDDVPDGLLAALDGAAVYHRRLPGVGLGLILDETVEAALREDGFDLTRIAPETENAEPPDAAVVLPLMAADGRGEGTRPHRDDFRVGALIGQLADPYAPGAQMKALSAILLGAGTLAARGQQHGEASLHERLSGIEAALKELVEALAQRDPARSAGQGD